jgi:hypothetical protein
MFGLLAFVALFHALNYWSYIVYCEDIEIDYQNPTKFESMMFWPWIIGHRINNKDINKIFK